MLELQREEVVDKIKALLNDEQQKAVFYSGRSLVVFAGAGSGKTRVITYRIAYLLVNGVSPESIVGLTFTNKAAREMKERVEGLGLSGVDKIWLSTFHSFCAKILRKWGHLIGVNYNFTIIDEYEQIQLFDEILKKANLDEKGSKLAFIYNTLSQELKDAKDDPYYAVYADLLLEYEKVKKANNYLDFADLLKKGLELLKKGIPHKFKHVLVDEYQDINEIQYRIVKELARDADTIMVVGDDDQCVVEGEILTSSGKKNVADLREYEYVIAAAGNSEVGRFEVSKVSVDAYAGKVIAIETEFGKRIRVTPNHKIWVRFIPTTAGWGVMLKYKRKVGWRLAVEKPFWYLKGERKGLEQASKVWIVDVFDTYREALITMYHYSVKYGLPVLPFEAGEDSKITQDLIDEFYASISLEENARQFMQDKLLFEEEPHFVAIGEKAKYVMVCMFDSKRGGIMHHAVYFSHGDKSWALVDESEQYDFKKLYDFAKTATTVSDSYLFVAAKLIDNVPFILMPASHIRKGMEVAVVEEGVLNEVKPHLNNGSFIGLITRVEKQSDKSSKSVFPREIVPTENYRVVSEKVESIGIESYEGPIYDFEVKGVHNFVVNGVVVHNSIYSWRGANWQKILQFEKDFGGERVFLTKNYRSAKSIVEVANSLIENNTMRAPKRMVANNSSTEVVEVWEFNSGQEEASFVAENISILSHVFDSIGVLYRVNWLSADLERELAKRGIVYRIVGDTSFWDRAEVKDMLSFLRWTLNRRDMLALKRAARILKVGVGAKAVEKIAKELENFKEDGLFGGIEGVIERCLKGRQRKLLEFFRKVETASKPYDYMKLVLKNSKYESYLKAKYPKDWNERLDNVYKLLDYALEAQKEGASLLEFAERMALVHETDERASVSLMTIHASKGLEFDVVFVVAAEEGILPHSRSYTEDQIEEERRLMYVALTRARQKLFVSFANSRFYHGRFRLSEPSRFLYEMDDTFLDWKSRL